MLYSVYAREVDRDHLLGYVKGEEHDIVEYFADEGREIKLFPITGKIKVITHQMAVDKKTEREFGA